MAEIDKNVALTLNEREFIVRTQGGRLSARQIGHMFQLQPQALWLRCDLTHRVFLPSETGEFNLTSLSDYAQVHVEGPALAASMGNAGDATSSGSASAATNSLVATSPTVSGMGPSRRATLGGATSQWSGFRSVVHTSAPTARKKGVFSLKIVVARLRRTDGDKPHFDAIDQIYISITESTANQPFVLAAVRDQIGEDQVIVGADGFEIKESSGTEGFKFWKVNSRKLYSVSEDDVRPAPETPTRGTKRARSYRTRSPSQGGGDNEADCLTYEELRADIADIRAKTEAILALSKESKIPFGLRTLLSDTFKCCVCTAPMKPPILLARCCKSILGCEECINQWFSGPDALTKSCPRCRAERGYTETMRVLGLDDFLKGIKGLIDNADSEDAA